LSVTVDPSGQFLYATGSNTSVFRIDAATGALGFIGSVAVEGSFITSMGRIQ
jgi:6-phosphogluconolactonase (cycloisomerase 2 family)